MKTLTFSAVVAVILLAQTHSPAQESHLGGQSGLVQSRPLPFRAGPIVLENNYNNSAVYSIRVYHPQSPGNIFANWTISNTGRGNLLYNNQPLRLGSDWGIQIIFGTCQITHSKD